MFQYILKRYRCCRLRREIGVGERRRRGGVAQTQVRRSTTMVTSSPWGEPVPNRETSLSISAMISRSISRPGLGLRRTIGRVGSACGFTPAAIGAVEDVLPVPFPLLSPLEGALADRAHLLLARGVVSAFHGDGVCGSLARHGLVDWCGADSFAWATIATVGSTGKSSNSSMGSTGASSTAWASEPEANAARDARDIMRCWV